MAQDINFAILTVSDTCYGDPSKDTSGPGLEKAVQTTFPKARVIYKNIVPDNQIMIQNYLTEKSIRSSLIDVILVTGGTGFGVRDVTPEATRAVIEKEAPGLAVAMISKSMEITPMAMLSRLVCGIKNHTIIINLPGSAKGSSECFGFITKALPHAVSLARSDLTQVQKDHKEIQGTSERSPSKVQLKVAFRNRKSPYPMLEVEEAIGIVLKKAKEMIETPYIEEKDLIDCPDRISAEDVAAEEPLPPFPASIKDGYAVIAGDGDGIKKVKDVVAAGDILKQEPLKSGEVIRISTGAPVPNGANAVVQVEDTELVKASDDGTKELEVNIKIKPNVGLDIRPVGCDMPAGTLLLNRKDRVTFGHVGVLVSIGKTTLKVYKSVRVGILSTGNELQNPGEPLLPYHIRDSNKSSLMAFLKRFNFTTSDCGIAIDTPDSVKEKLLNALSNNDVVISTGGVSMGEFDVIKKVLEVDFGAEVLFGRVNMKPGKPTTFATCTFNGKKKLIFGLPGNPVSALVTCTLFVIPALRTINQQSVVNLPTIPVFLQGVKGPLDQRPEYIRVRVGPPSERLPKIFTATPTGDQISSRLNSFVGACGLVRLPSRDDPNAAPALENGVFQMMLIDPSGLSFS